MCPQINRIAEQDVYNYVAIQISLINTFTNSSSRIFTAKKLTENKK